MPARCRPRPEYEVAHSSENNLQLQAAWCSARWALCQKTTAWSRCFPSSYSCSLLIQHVSMLGFYRWGFWPTIQHSACCLSFVFSSPPDARWLVSTRDFLSKGIYWIQQEAKGNFKGWMIIPKGQGRRSIYEDRVDQSPCTAQTKLNCLQIVVARWEARWYLQDSKVKWRPSQRHMVQFCKGLGIITERRNRESIGLEHQVPGFHCLSWGTDMLLEKKPFT